MDTFYFLVSFSGSMLYTHFFIRGPRRDGVNRELTFFLVVNHKLGYGRDRELGFLYERESDISLG